MVRKFLLLSSVLFAFCQMAGESFAADAAALLEQAKAYQKNKDYESAERLYQQIISDYPQSDFAMKTHEKLAILYISTERDADAQAVIDDLTAGFADATGLPKALYNIARTFERYQTRKYDAATELYQLLIERWPDNAEAGRAALRLARLDVLSLIASGQDSEAQEKLDNLLTNFSGQTDLPGVIYDIARAYEGRPRRKYDAANKVYQEIIERWPDNPLAEGLPLSIARNEILLLIDAGDISGAQAKISDLAANFSGHPELAGALYRIARGYEEQGKYKEAQGVYQQIIQQFGDSPEADRAQLGIAKSEIIIFIADGQTIAAQEALGQLVAAFSGHSALPRVVFQIGEQYYNDALRYKSEGLVSQAEDRYTKAVSVWERIIKELPGSTIDTAHAYYFSAECYRSLGEYEKAIEYHQRVVDSWPDYEYAWHALAMVGRNYEDLKESGLISRSEADTGTKAAYQQLLENYPDCKAASIARRWLSRHNSK